jgi:hypothetical protein
LNAGKTVFVAIAAQSSSQFFLAGISVLHYLPVISDRIPVDLIYTPDKLTVMVVQFFFKPTHISFADKQEHNCHSDIIFSTSYEKGKLVLLFLWSDT